MHNTECASNLKMRRLVFIVLHLIGSVTHATKNVVFFMPDDGDLPSSLLTPNFDRIRTEGVIFNSAYAAGTSCAPSRFNIITGRYCSRSIFAQADSLSADGPTWVDSSNTCKLDSTDLVLNLAHQLKLHGGYRTIISGKWHLSKRSSNYHDYNADAATIQNAGFTDPVAIYTENLPTAPSRGVAELGFTHNMEWLTANANAAIKDAVINESAPFFLYFTPTSPHVPSIIQALTDFRLIDTPAGILDTDPVHLHRHTRDQLLNITGGNEYDAATIWSDDALGSLIAVMESLNVLNDTLIIVTMDHGVPKFGIQQSSARVSMFARLPGIIPAGSFIEFPTSHLDIAPTIFEFTGVNPDAGYTTDGKSWFDAATGTNAASSRRCVIFEHYQNRAVSCDKDGMKLSFFYSSSTYGLYNIEVDPAEDSNLFDEAGYSEAQVFLLQYLECHMNSTDPKNPTTCEPEDLRGGFGSMVNQTSLPMPSPTLADTTSTPVTPGPTTLVTIKPTEYLLLPDTPYDTTVDPTLLPTSAPSSLPLFAPSTTGVEFIDPSNRPSPIPSISPTVMNSYLIDPSPAPSAMPFLSPTQKGTITLHPSSALSVTPLNSPTPMNSVYMQDISPVPSLMASLPSSDARALSVECYILMSTPKSGISEIETEFLFETVADMLNLSKTNIKNFLVDVNQIKVRRQLFASYRIEIFFTVVASLHGESTESPTAFADRLQGYLESGTFAAEVAFDLDEIVTIQAVTTVVGEATQSFKPTSAPFQAPSNYPSSPPQSYAESESSDGVELFTASMLKVGAAFLLIGTGAAFLCHYAKKQRRAASA